MIYKWTRISPIKNHAKHYKCTTFSLKSTISIPPQTYRWTVTAVKYSLTHTNKGNLIRCVSTANVATKKICTPHKMSCCVVSWCVETRTQPNRLNAKYIVQHDAICKLNFTSSRRTAFSETHPITILILFYHQNTFLL